jgi:hypothetical protein
VNTVVTGEIMLGGIHFADDIPPPPRFRIFATCQISEIRLQTERFKMLKVD